MPPHPLPTNINVDCDGLLLCTLDWANNVTNGLFMPLILLAFCVVMFMATNRLGTPRSFGFAGFVAITGAISFASLNLLEWWIASIFIIVGGISLVGLIVSER